MAWSARVSRWAAPGHVDSAAADDPLLGALPGEFATMNGHFQAVLALPPQATLLAATQRDPHHAYRIGRCAWGIQWHPELDADVLAEYVARERVRNWPRPKSMWTRHWQRWRPRPSPAACCPSSWTWRAPHSPTARR
ncbi:MAG: hypothetical protein R2854_03105 [Caldilineaceae bacterium]